eukprot:8969010-Karenia_brevis.AAC.1
MVNALSKPAWGHLYDLATPDHGRNNPWLGCDKSRKELGSITKPWSSGDTPQEGDKYLIIDCT